ncbi:MAG TPA: hypothetical protein VGF73_08995 [Chthoniobacterales bacterium]
MKKHLHLRVVASLFLLPFLGAAAQAGTASIDVLATFDYPGASTTHPMAINIANGVTGSFVDTDARTKGFVRDSHGNFSAPLVEPKDFGLETVPAGINDSGLVSGYFTGPGAIFSGFFLSGSSYTEFAVPGAQDTFVTGLNNAEDFAGYDSDPATGKTHAFVNIGGTIIPIGLPGSSYCYAINNNNQYCGYYRTGGASHGFYTDRNGVLQYPIDAPEGAAMFRGINDRGWLVGSTTDSALTTHALLFIPPRNFITFDYPGASFTRFTGINDNGLISGEESDDLFGTPSHGFIARARLSRTGD